MTCRPHCRGITKNTELPEVLGEVVGTGAGWAAGAAYDHYSSEDTRNTIDRLAKDAGHAAAEAASDARHSVLG